MTSPEVKILVFSDTIYVHVCFSDVNTIFKWICGLPVKFLDDDDDLINSSQHISEFWDEGEHDEK